MKTQDGNPLFRATIGDVVRAWREEQELTVTKLAHLSGPSISKGYISQLEHNKVRQPSDENLVRLAEGLKVPVLFLVMRRLPHELTAEEQAELAKLRNTPEDTGGFNFSAPHLLPEERLKEEDDLRQLLVFADALCDEEEQLQLQQKQIQQRLFQVKRLRDLVGQHIEKREKGE